jgi:hypothetical protein
MDRRAANSFDAESLGVLIRPVDARSNEQHDSSISLQPLLSMHVLAEPVAHRPIAYFQPGIKATA